MMQNFNDNSRNYCNKSKFIVHDDKQRNKRPAKESWKDAVPAKKCITTTSNSNCTLQLKCHENFNLQVTKHIDNNLNRSNVYYKDNSQKIHHSNTTENFNALKQQLNDSEKITPQNMPRKRKINEENLSNNDCNPMDKNSTNKNENQKSSHENLIKCSQFLNSSDNSNVLYPNVPPSKKMKERMADALEGIFYITSKAMCNQPNVNDSDMKLFDSSFKTIISERIKKVLMGRPVTSRSDIIDSYLRRYPKGTDTELMVVFKDRNNINSCMPYLIQADDPKEYYTVNMKRLINTKMKKIISVVETMYENSEKQLNDCIKNKPIQHRSSENGNHEDVTEPNYRIQNCIFYDKSMSYRIESEFSNLFQKFRNEIAHMILGKEICHAIEMNLLQRTRRRDDNMENNLI